MKKLLLNRKFRIPSLILITFIINSLPVTADDFDPNTGYRIDAYRQVINKDLDIGRQIDSEVELNQLIKSGALLIDVAPIPRYLWIDDLGMWQLPSEQMSIPEAIWLPNVGRGVLDRELHNYLTVNLTKFASLERPIVVFCFEDCWMSWNATQRIARLGYKNVFWYPKGVTGRRADQLQPVEPEPFRY